PSIPPASVSAPAVHVDVAMAARRDALARRLLGARASSSSPPAASTPSGAPVAAPAPPSASDAMEALKRRYEDRVLRAKAAEARKYAGNGQTATAAGDVIAAAN